MTAVRAAILSLLLLTACQGQERASSSDTAVGSFSPPPAEPVWNSDTPRSDLTSQDIRLLADFYGRLHASSQQIAAAKAPDCEGANPGILKVVTTVASQLDTLYSFKPVLLSSPHNLDGASLEEWNKIGQDIAFIFSDGRNLLNTVKVKPLSEALIRSWGEGLSSRAEADEQSLRRIAVSLGKNP